MTWHFYSKLDFWKIFIRNYILLFPDFESMMFHNNIGKISEILNKWSLLKSAFKLPTLLVLHNLEPFLLRKMEFFKVLNPLNRIKLLCIGSFDKRFRSESWQKFTNLFLSSKAPCKNWLSERYWKQSGSFDYLLWNACLLYAKDLLRRSIWW